MLYDQLCAVVERHLPELIPVVGTASLFYFPKLPHDVLPKTYTEDKGQWYTDNFILPFPCICIEDPASLVILLDLVPEQIGIKNDRIFIEVVPFNAAAAGNFREADAEDAIGQEDLDFLNSFPHGTISISYGVIKDARFVMNNDRHSLKYNSQLSWTCVGNKQAMLISKEHYVQLAETDKLIFRKAATINTGISMQEIMYFTDPDNFIIEKRYPKLIARRAARKKGPKIARSQERSIYICMTKKEIEETFEPTTGPKQERKFKGRRRHYRTYRHERYKHLRKERGLSNNDPIRVVIPAVIPKDWKLEMHRGKQVYKIRLDI